MFSFHHIQLEQLKYFPTGSICNLHPPSSQRMLQKRFISMDIFIKMFYFKENCYENLLFLISTFYSNENCYKKFYFLNQRFILKEIVIKTFYFIRFFLNNILKFIKNFLTNFSLTIFNGFALLTFFYRSEIKKSFFLQSELKKKD